MSHDEQAHRSQVSGDPSSGTAKQPWTPPAVTDLPRLTELTLQGQYGGGPIGEPIEGGPSIFPGLGF